MVKHGLDAQQIVTPRMVAVIKGLNGFKIDNHRVKK